jgi:hypothetical protein
VHRRLVTVIAIPIFAFSLGVSGMAVASIPAAQAAPLAPAIGGAASGGLVIVTLKDQYSNLKVGPWYRRSSPQAAPTCSNWTA